VTPSTPFLNYYFSSVHIYLACLTPSRHLTTHPLHDLLISCPSLYHTDSSRPCRRMQLALRQRHLKRDLLSSNTARSYFKVCGGHTISTCSLTELIGRKTHFVAHDVGWIITGFFTIVATVASFWLINKHLQWYTIVRSLSARPEPVLISTILFTQKREQRCRLFYFATLHVVCAVSPADFNILFADIIRLLLMVPIYSWISLASYLFWVRSLVSDAFVAR
jgi:hypothetical protein